MKPVKAQKITLLLVSISAIFILAVGGCDNYLLRPGSRRVDIYIKNVRFNVEVAATPARRLRGLMYRKKLPRDSGMLFVFEEAGEHPFWMKNTFIPLDIIWLDSGGTILHAVRNAAPWPVGSPPVINPAGIKSKYVLELNGGLLANIGADVGDKIIFSEDKNFFQ